jgi:hypothetical protein
VIGQKMDDLRTLIRTLLFYIDGRFLECFMYFLYGGIITLCIIDIVEQTIRLNHQYEIDKEAKHKASLRRYKREKNKKKKNDAASERAKRLSNG